MTTTSPTINRSPLTLGAASSPNSVHNLQDHDQSPSCNTKPILMIPENCSPTTTTTTTKGTFSSHPNDSLPESMGQPQKQQPIGVSYFPDLQDSTTDNKKNDKNDDDNHCVHESYSEDADGEADVQQQYRLDFSALKVNGRDEHVQRLHKIYQHVTQKQRTKSIDSSSSSRQETTTRSSSSAAAVAMIKGMSGTGKSTLVKKFLQELEAQQEKKKSPLLLAEESDGPTTTVLRKPYVLSGKCDELSGGDPFSAIVEAVSGFATMLVREESKEELKRIQRAVHASLGKSEAQALMTMIPTLRHVMATTTTTTTTTTSRSAKNKQNETMEERAVKETESYSEQVTVASNPSSNTATTTATDVIIRPTLSGSKENAWNRLKYIFQMFTRAISTMERPVIMFLDDLQWCDAASLELLEALWTDQDLKCFMFVGAYRAEEVHPDLVLTLETIQHAKNNNNARNSSSSSSLVVEMIELVNLTLPELHSFIADALHPNREDRLGDNINALAEMIYRKTLGNILFAVQALEELQRKGILFFSRKTMEWEWNFLDDDARGHHWEDLVSDNVVASITSKISSTSPLLQQALVLAAYTRSTVDIDTLYQLLLSLELPGSDRGPTTTTTTTITCPELVKLLDEAVVDGLLYNTMGSKSYSFAHDRIQQAAYAMVPSGRERDAFRLKIGQRLYEMGKQSSAPLSLDGRQNDWMLFVAADHLNATANQVRNTKGKLFLIQLNLELGERAASVAAYEIASKYLRLALECSLQGAITDPWDTEYETTLQIHRCLVDVELCQGHFEVGSNMGRSVLQHARTVEDKLPTHIALVKALRREQKHRRSFDLSVQSLRGLKEYPRGWVGVHAGLVKDFLYVQRYFKKNSNDAILKLPSMMDERLIQTMELLGLNGYQAFQCDKKVEFLAAILRMLRLTFQHGLCGNSGVAVIGWTLFRDSLNDMEGVTRCSRLALDILRITKAKEQECLQLFVVANWICAWKDPPEHILEIFSRAHQSGMESGDFENALLNQTVSYQYEFLAGYSLVQLDTKCASLIDKLDLYKVHSIKAITTQQWLVVQHLRGSGPAPTLNFAELEAFGFDTHDGSEKYRVLHGCLSRMQLGVYFGNYQFSEVFTHKVSPLVGLDSSHFTNSIQLFFGSLTYATLAREKKKQKRSYRSKAKKYAQKLKATCKVKGMNSWHRYLLADAHCFAGSSKSGDSIQSKYDHAIAAALKGGHGQDAALGCQLVAEHFLAMQDGILFNELARAREWTVQQYLTQARDWYLQWGAMGLVQHLETKYRRYLLPTLSSMVDYDDNDDQSIADSMDLGDATEYCPSLPKMVVHHQPEDEVSVISDQSAWRQPPPLFSYLHTEADGRLPAVLELE